AAGLANLEFMLREDLPEQSSTKGAAALAKLRALGERLPAIGEARGLGLMIGVELVTDREKRTPAAALAREVRRYCREHGVLVGVGGSEGNVVRVQPPLVISEADLNEALDVIGAGIESLSAAHVG
ncbi:MAG: aminotransferase class III-fold pyridoxal phosphate-dependent enzyme, partial [Chloroflexota bacterium]|nr:aminotransferase class III-fold pyridoxal phosphate-dependent enzyme [Chloroflexota bacterium]